MRNPLPTDAAIAAHRFGLGEPDLALLGTDLGAWLRAQIGPADAQRGANLPGLAAALACQNDARRLRSDAARAALRAQVQADIRARLATAASTARPFAERLALFWANHFTVSLAKGSTQGLVGAFEREAIRPHIAGRFADLLAAAVSHPAMLRYLDNTQSAGPQSSVALRLRRRGQAEAARADPALPPAPARIGGLNENLAREVLELHTLGVAGGGGVYGPWGGYSQADVAALAAVLTGWRGPRPDSVGSSAAGSSSAGNEAASPFHAAWHQPGPKTVLGRVYAEGPQALRAVLDDLARHPATARHLATKLARHLVADQPPPALVARLAQRFTQSDGDLAALYGALIDSPEAWAAAAPAASAATASAAPVAAAPPAKLKTPEEFVLSSARLLRLGDRLAARAADAGLAALGQRPQAAPSPAGWPDSATDWLGPEAVWQRLEWASQLADRQGAAIDARALAAASLGPLLSAATQRQIERAADGPQALTLLLMAPEFQRR